MGQSHQHFTSSFCMRRSQKRKKDNQLINVFFALLGSMCVKATQKNVNEIDPMCFLGHENLFLLRECLTECPHSLSWTIFPSQIWRNGSFLRRKANVKPFNFRFNLNVASKICSLILSEGNPNLKVTKLVLNVIIAHFFNLCSLGSLTRGPRATCAWLRTALNYHQTSSNFSYN